MSREPLEMPVNREWPDPGYLTIFRPEVANQLRHYETSIIKVRDPISVFEYGKDFFVVQTKIHLSDRTGLKNIIEEEKGYVDGSDYVYYSKNNLPGLIANFRIARIQPISRIYLTTADNSLQTVRLDDSIACYYLKNGRFSIRYGKDSIVDMYNSGPESSIFSTDYARPVSLMFIAKGDSAYFLLAGTRNEKAILPKDLLIGLIKGYD